MNTARIYRTQLPRLHLSTRYQCLQRRANSTARPAPTPTPTATTSQQTDPSQSFFRRNRGALFFATLSLLAGVVGGQFVVHTLSPPPFPEIGTPEDGVLLADLNRQIEEHFKVKVLRGKCLGVTRQLKGEDGGWFEVIPLPVDMSENRVDAEHNLMTHMQGAKGVGVERLFWDRGEQKLVVVLWVGGSLCGWPGVTHGGAIATVLAEKLSLAAALANTRNSDTLAAATPQRLPGTGDHAKMLAPATTPDEPAQLSLGYFKPTFANQFYVVRVQPAFPENGDAGLTPEPYGGAEYEATLETVEGKVCVKARAKFAASTAVQRAERKVGEGVGEGYRMFREWMWPSRQQESSRG